MDRRRLLLTSLAGALAAPLAAAAQQGGKLPRVGYVQAGIPSATPLREAFLTGLRERDWNDGRNVVIDRRRRDEEIGDLVRLNVDVLVLPNPYRIEAGLKQTKSRFLLTGAVAVPRVSGAERVPRVGFLNEGKSRRDNPTRARFEDGLREHGHVAGTNLVLETRSTTASILTTSSAAPAATSLESSTAPSPKIFPSSSRQSSSLSSTAEPPRRSAPRSRRRCCCGRIR